MHVSEVKAFIKGFEITAFSTRDNCKIALVAQDWSYSVQSSVYFRVFILSLKETTMKKYRVTLTDSEVDLLEALTKHGKRSARIIRNANVLLNCHESLKGKKQKDATVAHSLGVTVRTLENIRKRFVVEDFEVALYGKKSERVYPCKVDNEGNVSKGGGNAGSGTTPDTDILRNNEKLKKLFLEILDEFEEDIDTWMINNGKGPLDDQVLNRLLEFPDCLPQNVESLEKVLEIIKEYKNNPEALLDSVLQDAANEEFIEGQLANLVGPEPYRQHFTAEAWQAFKEMICAYLRRLEEERITYEGFVATVQGDTVRTDEIYVVNASQVEFKLAYWSKTDDVGELSYKVILAEGGKTITKEQPYTESYSTDDDDELTRNKPWTLVLEPVKEGKYTITHKVGDGDEVEHEFWVRKQN
ncbi:MAG: hypothetical protein MI921_01580 [Cytophagales bacterium]|nr:hypothetical protein [Cytophagales bacterium]